MGSWKTRFYQAEEDLKQMQDMLMEARSRTNDWRYSHVGELAWDFFMVACHLNPRKHIRLWHDKRGVLAGYSILGENPSFTCQVFPEYEWSGIETAAMAWAETSLSALRRRDAGRWCGNLTCGARQDDPDRMVFLERHGFHRGTYGEFNLIRSLDEPIPDPVLPTSCRIHAGMNADDIPNRAAAQREVWAPWTVGNVSDGDYARLMRLPGYDRDLDIVAVAPDGVIAAYVNGWIDPLNRIGDFGPIGTRPAYRRQGLARAVLLEGLRRMRECGMDRVCVSTGDSNTPAISLYESIGFTKVNKYLEYVKK